MSESSTNRSQQWLSPELVNLVTYTVETIAKSKGYLTYPKEVEVKLVLQALYIVNEAIEIKEGQNVGRGRKNQDSRL